MKILTVVGARPQFVKIGPLSRLLRARHAEVLVHTGQHYDHGMSAVFFEELGLPEPDYNLGIGGGGHGEQTGAMLAALEAVCRKESPDAVLVLGDTNSTLAGALAAAKLHIPVAHVEAGLRSHNRLMPEEVNRIMADHLSSLLLVPARSSAQTLRAEGITEGVVVVGDIMYDAVLAHSGDEDSRARRLAAFGVERRGYHLCTIHRPENTEHRHRLEGIFAGLAALDLPVLLPLHPRTAKALARHDLSPPANVRVLEPLGYGDMLRLQAGAACVLSDSGGIQKEAYYLGVPCVTLRDETEWVETVEAGWNVVCGADPEAIARWGRELVGLSLPRPDLYGDGRTAGRIVEALETPGLWRFGGNKA